MNKSAESWAGTWHSLAERFPMLGEDELREMAASIAEHGQYVPCRMTAEGLGLDGRNRVAACALAEVEPVWEVYDGEPISFIVEVNAERRHLTTGQRAMAVALGLVEAGARSNGRFKRGSVPGGDNGRSSVSGSSWRKKVQEAGVVLDHAPELADSVLDGELALDAVYKQADERRRGKDRVAALGGELAALVENGVIDVEEAERRAADEARLADLAEDLTERVRDGGLSLDEADAITREREERLDVWAEKVRGAMAVLAGLAGHPIPAGLENRLDADEQKRLGLLLKGVPKEEDT